MIELLLKGTFALTLALMAASAAMPQKIAVLAPGDPGTSSHLISVLEEGIKGATIIDGGLARAAYDAVKTGAPFNLTLGEAKRIGQAIGCDFFVLVRSGVQRRTSFEREEYYEASAAIFVVSTRTGRLVGFEHELLTAATAGEATSKLIRSIPEHGRHIAERARGVQKDELAEKGSLPMEEPPDADTPAARNFRPPVPFQRIKPEYTKLAEQFDVTATVEVLVDLDETGKVLRTETVRWAGFDLDESADKAVRAMNWRPAERDGKFIPMRFLVRYSFKKVERAR